jgi:hypothetical protein
LPAVIVPVKTQHVDAGERLHGRELLDEHVPPAEVDDANREGQALHQHQTLGDHMDHAGDRAAQRRLHSLRAELAGEEQDRRRYQQPRHQRDDPVDSSAEFRPCQGEPARLLGQLRRVRLAPDPGGSVGEPSGRHETSRQDLVAGPFAGLASEQRFVQLGGGRVQHLPVDHHLVARAGLEHVIEDDLLDVHVLRAAVADHPGHRRADYGQPLEGALGPYLLDDADHGVGDQDQPEQGVLQRADEQDDGQQGPEQEVEAGQDVGPDDLRDRPGRGIGHVIREVPTHPIGDLARCQAVHWLSMFRSNAALTSVDRPAAPVRRV